MFGKKVIAVDTLIGENCTINGDITTEKSMKIDGKVTGSVSSSEDIIIGETGKVSGSVEGRSVLVSGMVNNAITASAQIRITETGKVKGTLTYQSIVIDDGASFEGSCICTAPQPMPGDKTEKLELDKKTLSDEDVAKSK